MTKSGKKPLKNNCKALKTIRHRNIMRFYKINIIKSKQMFKIKHLSYGLVDSRFKIRLIIQRFFQI